MRGWGFRGTPSTSRFKGYFRAVGGRTTAQAIARRGAQRATRPRGCGGGGEPPPRLLTGTFYGQFPGTFRGRVRASVASERSGAKRSEVGREGGLGCAFGLPKIAHPRPTPTRIDNGAAPASPASFASPPAVVDPLPYICRTCRREKMDGDTAEGRAIREKVAIHLLAAKWPRMQGRG